MSLIQMPFSSAHVISSRSGSMFTDGYFLGEPLSTAGPVAKVYSPLIASFNRRICVIRYLAGSSHMVRVLACLQQV
ncbi:hypothetical protein, variant [Exophiala xenobiotica]|uniref:Uncharacterized protein n=1 Tax=Exophiala xenobiotica TaxID=348802 RepID=A0A0D2E9T8_9EURO|nr:hypothetical protein, variant [Exophiala xenobiotica]XP_013312717.1 uncharacterized protein PV05_07797 [Exophiala xenobiotica]KIW52132.1 hypothetical protein PV05_07797 [Exophiala xenobiotica]KIW52133.1 hypothetical protein, variant [Exophiala xenobiotica]